MSLKADLAGFVQSLLIPPRFFIYCTYDLKIEGEGAYVEMG